MEQQIEQRKSNKILLIALALAVLAIAVVYGFVSDSSTAEESDLIYWRENHQLDEDLRIMLEQRLAMLTSGIDAYAAAGEEVDMSTLAFAGETAWFLGDLGSARELYEELLDRNSINYVTWNNYGNVLKLMGDADGALDAYKQAYNLMGTEEYYRDYITLLEETYPERDEEVLEVLEQAVDEIGQTQWLMVAIAEWYLEHDDCDRALSHYDIALSLAEGTADDAIQAEIDEVKATCNSGE